MLTCKQATELASQAMDRNLGAMERLGFDFHLLICSGCRAAKKQFSFLRQLTSAYSEHLPVDDKSLPG